MGYTIDDAFILLNGEGCMSQAAALGKSPLFPSVLGEVPEVEGWEIKFLPLNLGRGRE